jgi:hypothetical protein
MPATLLSQYTPAASKIGEAPHDDTRKVVRECLAQNGLVVLPRKEDGLIEGVVAHRRDLLDRQDTLFVRYWT